MYFTNGCPFFADTWTDLVRMSIEADGSGSATFSVFPLRVPPLGTGAIDVRIVTADTDQLLDSVTKNVLIEVGGLAT